MAYEVDIFDPSERITTGENGLPEIRLRDGRIARFIRRLKVRDVKMAHDATKSGNGVSIAANFVARLLEIDGHPVNADQIMELDADEFNAIQEVIPGNFTKT
jgi:hypothetical protein